LAGRNNLPPGKKFVLHVTLTSIPTLTGSTLNFPQIFFNLIAVITIIYIFWHVSLDYSKTWLSLILQWENSHG
jgi:hypothetical protein